jgi:glucose-6-phosphate 1-dehydrogenase
MKQSRLCSSQSAVSPALRPMIPSFLNSRSRANHLFYVSTPASVAGPIIEGLGAVGLNRREHGWKRFVLEKPFGRDLESANVLSDVVRGAFDEKTVYRIDHYLGKETAQNILLFHFSNPLVRAGVEQGLHRVRRDHRD